jgi:hypothetical protein
MNKKEIIQEFLSNNLECTIDDVEFRFDGRLEWFCECGIGHTVYSPDKNFVHGCCGHCRKIIPVNSISNPEGEKEDEWEEDDDED